MVEISKSGSGEGSVWVTGRSYSTTAVLEHARPVISKRSEKPKKPDDE
jgi:hypothetical protein